MNLFWNTLSLVPATGESVNNTPYIIAGIGFAVLLVVVFLTMRDRDK